MNRHEVDAWATELEGAAKSRLASAAVYDGHGDMHMGAPDTPQTPAARDRAIAARYTARAALLRRLLDDSVWWDTVYAACKHLAIQAGAPCLNGAAKAAIRDAALGPDFEPRAAQAAAAAQHRIDELHVKSFGIRIMAGIDGAPSWEICIRCGTRAVKGICPNVMCPGDQRSKAAPPPPEGPGLVYFPGDGAPQEPRPGGKPWPK